MSTVSVRRSHVGHIWREKSLPTRHQAAYSAPACLLFSFGEKSSGLLYIDSICLCSTLSLLGLRTPLSFCWVRRHCMIVASVELRKKEIKTRNADHPFRKRVKGCDCLIFSSSRICCALLFFQSAVRGWEA